MSALRYLRGNGPLLLAGLAVAFAVFGWPPLALVVGALHDTGPGYEANWGGGAYARLLAHPLFWSALGNTVLLAVLLVPASILFALFLAIAASYGNARLSRLVAPVVLIQYAIPSTFYAIAFALLANGRAGFLNDLLALVHPWLRVFDFSSTFGVFFVTWLRMSGFAFILLIGPVANLNRGQDEAALVAGAGLWRRIFTIYAPALKVAVASCVIMMTLAAITTFDAVYILGANEGFYTLSVLTYRLLGQEAEPDFGAATAASTFILAVAVVLVVVQQARTRREASVTLSGKPESRPQLDFGAGRGVVDALLAVYFLVVLVLPAASIVMTSISPFPGVYSSISLRSFWRLLASPMVIEAFGRTMILAFAGALLAVAAGVLFVIVRLHVRGRVVTSLYAALGLAPTVLAGVIGALGYIWAVIIIEPLRPLYGSFALMLMALASGAVPSVILLMSGAFAQIDTSLGAAARAAGASRLSIARNILLPLVLPSLANAFYVAFATIAGALDVVLVLGSMHLKTVPMVVNEYYGAGRLGETGALLVAQLAAFALLRLLLQLLVHAARPDLRRSARRGAPPASKPASARRVPPNPFIRNAAQPATQA